MKVSVGLNILSLTYLETIIAFIKYLTAYREDHTHTYIYTTEQY